MRNSHKLKVDDQLLGIHRFMIHLPQIISKITVSEIILDFQRMWEWGTNDYCNIYLKDIFSGLPLINTKEVTTGLGPASCPMGPTSLILFPPPHLTSLFLMITLWRRSGRSTAWPSYSYIKLCDTGLKVIAIWKRPQLQQIVLDRLPLSNSLSNFP